jgi:simple sugar transport system permease protein
MRDAVSARGAWFRAAVVGAVGVLGLGALFVVLAGGNPGSVLATFLSGTFGSSYGVGQLIFKATPLIFTGLAVAVPLRAGLFNIGAEGQLMVGAFCAAVAGLQLGGWPAVVALPVAALAAFVGGAAWGAVSGALKARFGAHEVITTIMLNFVAVAVTGYLVTYHLAVPETIRTEVLPEPTWIPRLSEFIEPLRGSSANLTFVIAVGVAALTGFLLWRTRLGFEIRAVGAGARAAEAAGISVGRTHVKALALGGGIAGLVGLNQVLGFRHYFESNFSEGAGFLGIAVAMLGRSHPIGVVVAALLFGWLGHGSLVINRVVPRELITVLQAVIIFAVLAADSWVKRTRRRREQSKAGAHV